MIIFRASARPSLTTSMSIPTGCPLAKHDNGNSAMFTAGTVNIIRPEHHDSWVIRRQRLKVTTACQACRSRKTKCDGSRPGNPHLCPSLTPLVLTSHADTKNAQHALGVKPKERLVTTIVLLRLATSRASLPQGKHRSIFLSSFPLHLQQPIHLHQPIRLWCPRHRQA